MADRVRVGFDALFFEQPMTGAGRYAVNLWRKLNELSAPGEMALLAPEDTGELARAEGGGCLETVRMPPLRGRPRKLWWEQAGLPLAVRSVSPPLDLVHVPYFAAPALKSVPFVVTIHDLIPLVMAPYRGSAAMRAYMRLVTRTAGSAALVLTDSDYSRDEIIRELSFSPERVVSVPLAAGDQFTPASTDTDFEAVAAVRSRYGLERPYILNTGGLDIRKNVSSVIEGFALARSRLKVEYDLVIVGRAHTGNNRMYPLLEKVARRLGVSGQVRFVGAVDDDEFVALYRGAEFFVYASTYEGFGLTPLEAMACGVPVVSTGLTSLAEVVGDAGLIIQPTPGGVAQGIAALANDDGLRADLASRGLERAGRYSWETAAEQTRAAYHAALEAGGV